MLCFSSEVDTTWISFNGTVFWVFDDVKLKTSKASYSSRCKKKQLKFVVHILDDIEADDNFLSQVMLSDEVPSLQKLTVSNETVIGISVQKLENVTGEQ